MHAYEALTTCTFNGVCHNAHTDDMYHLSCVHLLCQNQTDTFSKITYILYFSI